MGPVGTHFGCCLSFLLGERNLDLLYSRQRVVKESIRDHVLQLHFRMQ